MTNKTSWLQRAGSCRKDRAVILQLLTGFAALAEPRAQSLLGEGPQMRTVTIRAQVPPGVGTVYLAGNRPELGSWDPHSFAMEQTNGNASPCYICPRVRDWNTNLHSAP